MNPAPHSTPAPSAPVAGSASAAPGSASAATPVTAAQILRARALALARPLAAPPAAETLLELLEFRLAQETYAVEARYVREVYPLKELTPLPCTPAFVRGIVNVRGRILPVFDLKKLFDLPDAGITDLHRIIIVHGHGLELGLLADVTVGMRSLPVASLQAPPPPSPASAAIT